MEKLFEPFELGDLLLANRMVMAPMTRNRASREGVVAEMMVEYYRQRSSAGLIVTESVPISAQGIGYPNTPGLFTESQVSGWLRLTNAVHSKGGRIYAQLQHCGRISHPSLQADNDLPVAPSAIKPGGHAVTYSGFQDFHTPRALQVGEISNIVTQFRLAAENARRAGFDGVEVHGANGYLIDQFLRDGTNHRQDIYGGNVENRMRLLNEVLDEICNVWPAGRVGLRLTPENRFNSMSDSQPQRHFEYIVQQLKGRELSYLHVLEGDMTMAQSDIDYQILRRAFGGVYIANNGYDRKKALAALQNNTADLIAFGIPFLANPDLVKRYKHDLPLNVADHAAFYGGDEIGYTDYPFFETSAESDINAREMVPA